MKSSFIKVLAMIAMLAFGSMISFAADIATNTGATPTETPLILDAITTQDDEHILVSFNQTIVAEAVRVRISKQSDGSSIKVEKITSVTDTPKSVLLNLTDVLEEGATYTLTVLSAISEGGVVIKEGADATKEFTTPVPLKKSVITFNAPTNPNAVIATTGSSVTPTTPTTTSASGTKTEKPETNAKELPLTGMNPLFFLIIAGGLAFAFISRRRA